jgi:hypothetical protein
MRKNNAAGAQAIPISQAAHTPPHRLSARSSVKMRKDSAAGAQAIPISQAAHTPPYRLSALSGERMNHFGGWGNRKSRIENLKRQAEREPSLLIGMTAKRANLEEGRTGGTRAIWDHGQDGRATSPV